MPIADDNPLDPSEAHLRRIRARAHRMWEQDGRPTDRLEEYLERARELDAIESNRPAQLPNPIDPDRPVMSPRVDAAVLQENLGEFPGISDQGDRMRTPETPEIARQFREGER
jgi:hypothetical protein